MTSGTSDLRAQALLYLAWARGACGRFVPGGEVAAPSGGPLDPGVRDAGPAASTVSPAPPEDAPGRAPAEGPAWDALVTSALGCRRCPLAAHRTHVVFGEGSRNPRLVVVGEAPGAEEDATGRPFVGRAGQLLTRMLAAIGLAREDVFIANVLKCRPPDNRPPAPDEVAACRPFLQEQLRRLAPDLLLLLGNHATRAVLGTDRGITSLRGRLHRTPDGLPALPTFHPAYLLRNPDAKREAWIDLQLVARTLGLSLPPRGEAAAGDRVRSGSEDGPSPRPR